MGESKLVIIQFLYEDGRSQVHDFLQSIRFQAQADQDYAKTFEGMMKVIAHLHQMKWLPYNLKNYWISIKTTNGYKRFHPLQSIPSPSNHLKLYEIRYNHIYSTNPRTLHWGARIFFFRERIKGQHVLFLTRALMVYDTLDQDLNRKSQELYEVCRQLSFEIYVDFLENPSKYLLRGSDS